MMDKIMIQPKAEAEEKIFNGSIGNVVEAKAKAQSWSSDQCSVFSVQSINPSILQFIILHSISLPVH